MAGSRLTVNLARDSFNTPWGFRLQGGVDLNQPLQVQRVFSNSPAEGELQRGDYILSINSSDTAPMSHKLAQDLIVNAGGQVKLTINRPPAGTAVAPLSPPPPQPRAPSLSESSSSYSHPQKNNTSTPLPVLARAPHPPHPPPSYQRSMAPPPKRPMTPPRDMDSNPSAPRPPAPPSQLHIQQAPPMAPPPDSRRRSITPCTPPPPWASQQAAPKRVFRKSQLGKGDPLHPGFSFCADYSSQTLPRTRRSHSAASAAAGHIPRARDEEPVREPDRLATGPIPRACHRGQLGGGGYSMGVTFGDAASTMPRMRKSSSQPPSRPAAPGGAPGFTPTKISLNKIGGGGPTYGTDYSSNRVHSNLENITLSPRTPEVQHTPLYQPAPPQPVYQAPPQQAPQYQAPPQAAYQAPRQDDPRQYTPMQMLLDQQRMEQERQEQELLRSNQQRPIPRGMSGPLGGQNQYSDLGIDYRSPNQRGWQPAPKAPRPKPQPIPQDPPVWQRPPQVDDDEGTPAWANTLRSSGPKPWERDLHNQVMQGDPRSVQQYAPPPQQQRAPQAPAPAPAVAPMSPHIMSPPQMLSPAPASPRVDNPMEILPMPGSEQYEQHIQAKKEPPKVVHLQYNSPMGLYSEQNMQETLAGQTAAAMEQTAKPHPDTRDWSQSAVLRFIEAENSRVKQYLRQRPAPATAPKPSVQQAPSYQQTPQYDDMGATDF